MRRQGIFRTLLFIVFFSIGGAALSGSILSSTLLRYYKNRQLLKSAEESLEKLKSLNADYDALLKWLRQDPNRIERIASATLGTQRQDANTVYPKLTPEQLDAARKALTDEPNPPFSRPVIPRWLQRTSEPSRRIILFIAGSSLILISFIFFGSAKTERPKKPK